MLAVRSKVKPEIKGVERISAAISGGKDAKEFRGFMPRCDMVAQHGQHRPAKSPAAAASSCYSRHNRHLKINIKLLLGPL